MSTGKQTALFTATPTPSYRAGLAGRSCSYSLGFLTSSRSKHREAYDGDALLLQSRTDRHLKSARRLLERESRPGDATVVLV